MTDLRVSLSEPQLEPISDAKHRLLLGQTVRQTEGNIDVEMSYKSFGSIEIGGILLFACNFCSRHTSIYILYYYVTYRYHVFHVMTLVLHFTS